MVFFRLIRMNRPNAFVATPPSRWRTAVVALVFAFLALRVAADTDSADPKRYLEDVKTLSAPVMEGRGAGTKGIERAANLIEQRYRTLGLQPAGVKSYFQPFTVITGAKLKEGNRLEVENGKTKQGLKLNQEFVPFSFSASGEVSGPVVFVGYGATAPEFGYDDYAHLDVKGQNRCSAALRTGGICREERECRTDAALPTDHESDQRSKSWREGRDHGQWETGR